MPVDVRPLGKQGLQVPRIGYGAMGATAFYGVEDVAAAEATALAAIDKYIELCSPQPVHIDTALIYAHPSGATNEALVGKAIAKHGRDKFIIATKFGVNPTTYAPASKPDEIREQLNISLSRLGTNYIDLYYQHRADPNTPVESVVGTLKELVNEGKIKYIGLSECTGDELRRGFAIHPITAIQMEYSLQTRDIENTVLPVARELGVGIVAYSPLGRGFLSATFTKPTDLHETDWRRTQPRFNSENFDKNYEAITKFNALAAKYNCTPAQLALAWLLSRGDDIFPIPGTKTAARLEENVKAMDVVKTLTKEQLEEVSMVVPEATGERYAGMRGTWNSRDNTSSTNTSSGH